MRNLFTGYLLGTIARSELLRLEITTEEWWADGTLLHAWKKLALACLGLQIAVLSVSLGVNQ